MCFCRLLEWNPNIVCRGVLHFIFHYFPASFLLFFSAFPSRNLSFCPIDGRQPFLPCSKGEIPATKLVTIPGRSHWILGSVFQNFKFQFNFFSQVNFFVESSLKSYLFTVSITVKPPQGKFESIWPQYRLLSARSDSGSKNLTFWSRSHLSGLNRGPGRSFGPHRWDQVSLLPLKGVNPFKKTTHFCLQNMSDPLVCFWKNLETPSPHLTRNVQSITQKLIFNLLRTVSVAQLPLSSTIVPFLFLFQFTTISCTNKV